MSYLVLARKYRPKHFGQMVGQEHVVRALGNALDTQRLHHAYLFTGTRGVGKTTVSRILAKSLNCVGTDGAGSVTSQPCGVCQACLDIDAGRFIDYTELDAASNRGIDDVQTLLEQAVYKPVQGRFKVFMIDEVHMLTGPAFNAMLKTLEEPPEYLKFVLATTDPQKVPVTVLSRCLQFNLRPMAPETVREHLERVLEAEQVPAEPQSLRLLARAARGSMRDALSLTDQAIAFGNGRLSDASVQQMLGSADRGSVLGLIDALAQGDGKAVVETVESLRRNGLHPASTLEEMAVVLQRMAVLQAVPGGIDDNDPDAAEIARLSESLPRDETQLLYSICLHGRAELGLAPDEYAGLTMVLLRLLAFKPDTTLAATAEKKNATDARLRLPQATRPVQRPPEVVRPAAIEVPAPAVEPQPEVASVPVAIVVDAAGPATALSMDDAGTHADPDVDSEPAAPLPVTAPVPAPVPAPPPGAVLSVREMDAAAHGNAPRRESADATRVLAVPVRMQATESSADIAVSRSASSAALVPTEEGDFWHQAVQRMVQEELITALVRELALQSQLIARDTDQWVLRLERETLNQGSTRERLQNALRSIGHDVRLAVEVGRVTDSPARRNQAVQEERQLAAERLIFEDPFVQSMMRDFGAKIVPGSIKPA